jgi:hypothetical protein
MPLMTLTGNKIHRPGGARIIFDLDAAAKAAYDVVRLESQRPTWWSDWEDCPPLEQDVWRRATAAALAEYDPETFGRARTELLRLWEVIGPVVKPYLAMVSPRDDS